MDAMVRARNRRQAAGRKRETFCVSADRLAARRRGLKNDNGRRAARTPALISGALSTDSWATGSDDNRV
jgi:hypothetical protein